MKTITLEADFADAVNETADVLASGGVAVFPTETVYGLVAVATPANAARINSIKGRDEGRPLPLLIGETHPLIRAIEREYRGMLPIWRMAPGPFTFVVSRGDSAPHLPASVLGLGYEKYGVRVPAYTPLLDLIGRAGVLISSSANVTEEAPPDAFSKVPRGMLDAADICVDGGSCVFGDASAAVELPSLKVVRESRIIPFPGGSRASQPIVITPHAPVTKNALKDAQTWLSYVQPLPSPSAAGRRVIDMRDVGATGRYYPYLSIADGLRSAGLDSIDGVGLIVPDALSRPLAHLAGFFAPGTA